MRPIRFFLAPAVVLGAVLPAAVAAQTRAECEYRNPDFPNWNYLRSCSVSTVTNGDRTTTTANVANGSTITVVEEGSGAAVRFVVNGHAATRLEDGASRCFLTTEDEETICLHGLAPTPAAEAAPDEDAEGETEAAPEAPETVTDLGTTTLGGGETGQCLAWITTPDREGLIETGDCIRRTNCAEVEGGAGVTCLIDLAWASGRETVITRQEGVYTLDGAVATPDAQGCLTDEGAGLHFCFSEAAMTETTYPALALAPAPDPVAPATQAALTDPSAEGTPAPAPAATGNRCSFLREEVEVSSWTCTEEIACDDPICTVTYVFENGTTVTLDTADGKVMLMNGAKSDAADWAEGTVVDVTRPGAPYTFRFTPGTATVAAE